LSASCVVKLFGPFGPSNFTELKLMLAVLTSIWERTSYCQLHSGLWAKVEIKTLGVT